ncbi:MAG: phenylalanine--tRNA ligase subunit beta [Nanoarchaeota archaeon]|nr:phenylalanine--tRNA ligase subunit beta [Nanoarchaeota archaeon]
MAIISINKKIFEKEIGKLDEKMQERIAMFGTPIETINEQELQLEIFPNRPDMLSYHGFKRAFLGFLGKKTGLISYKINKPEKNYRVTVDSSVNSIRPYTVCAIVKNLKFDSEKIKEIIDVQEKIHFTLGRKRKKLAIGIYPLEKIKLPITFKALEPDKIKFRPLESEREMSGLEILQKHPAGKEYAHLLAGKVKFPVFIDAENKILSMPPVINSDLTGKITQETKDVFIECSGFDWAALNKCLNIITTTLADMGGEIYQMEVKYKRTYLTPDLAPEKMKINLDDANKLLGLELKEKEIKNLLEKMGHNYSKGIVEIPAWRVDVLHEVDLIEDIAIAYGYENFTPEIPEISTIGQESQTEIIKRKISEILTGLNFLELSNFHLTKKPDQFAKMGLNEKNSKEVLEIENSKTDYNILRKDLSHYALKILSENVDVEYPQKIFETGRVFCVSEKTNEISESEKLCLAITPGNFTEAKQVIEYLFKMMDLNIKIDEPDIQQDAPVHFIEGRTAKIIFEGKTIGYLGEIHPKILSNWRIKMPVSLCEISLEDIFEKLGTD